MDLYENNWLYDLVHNDKAGDAQIRFYQRQIERFGEPVLELGCGSGNYLVALSNDLQNISGLDSSEEMLEAAGRKADAEGVSTDLHIGDMRNFAIEQKFKLIFAAGNSLQHVLTAEDLKSCFDSVRAHLFPFGRFIVEVFNPSLPLLCRPSDIRHFIGEYRTENGWVVVTENVRYDAATQINHIDWHYKNQYMKEEQTLSFQMRQFFPQELNALFAQNGFRVEAKYGDFDESEFCGRSPKQIVVARPQ
ncbi:MAG: class I SAM-dependent methyltransferase [Acidobacteria bacterium]|nr:class I SAM-dependent methyltransferase [Acidobacteriota bacterium]